MPLVEYAYNSIIYSSTGKKPFEVIEGKPKCPLILKTNDKIFTTDEYSRDLKDSFQKIREAIAKTQERQKVAANKHRKALTLKEND